MAQDALTFGIDEEMVFGGKLMRVAGLARFEGASGQRTTRYLLAEAFGAPVILEQGDERFSQLRPLPSGSQPHAAGNVLTVGDQKYSLVATRKLKVIGVAGQAFGATPKAQLLLSGIFEGPAGTLMREMAPGTAMQVYYLVKRLGAGEVLSATQHAAIKEAERRAAGDRPLEQD